jgi:hypothetical protein
MVAPGVVKLSYVCSAGLKPKICRKNAYEIVARAHFAVQNATKKVSDLGPFLEDEVCTKSSSSKKRWSRGTLGR